MITSLSGDDKVKISAFIADYKKKFSKGEIYNIDKNSETGLAVLTESQGLFSSKKLIAVLNPKAHEEFENEAWLETVHKDPDTELLVDLSSFNANLKIFKNIKKYSKHFSFVLPRDYSFFNLCDALFLNRNKLEAIKIIESIDDIDEKFLLLLATFQSSLRNFISLKYSNKASKTIHPFMAKKISSYKLSEKEVEALYSKLLELDFKSKTQKVDKKALLIDFVLYFF